MSKKLLIVEEALRDLKAHWFQYIQTIAEAADSFGWETDIACNVFAEREVVSRLSAYPIFKHARYLSNSIKKKPGERFYGFVLHSFRTVRDLWPFLKQQQRYDHIFVPTVLVHHLLAWYLIMKFHPHKPAKLTLFFVTNPGVWDPEKQKAFLPKSSLLLKKILQFFTKMISQGRVVLAVETMGAKREFESLTGLPVVLLPHPVPFEDTQVNDHQKAETPVFSCLGFARHEKGSDLLKRAIEEILSSSEKFNGHFVIQWTDAFKMPDGTTCQPGELLSKHPQVTIIDRALRSDEYEELILNTDCMMLPYRNSSYHARLSRIAIECACIGIPAIYSKGGWLQETIEKFGSGIGIEDESVESLIEAIRHLSDEEHLRKYRQLALAKKKLAVRHYSPENFVRQLIIG